MNIDQAMYDLVHTGSVYLDYPGLKGYFTQEAILELDSTSINDIFGDLDLNLKDSKEILAAHESLTQAVDEKLRSILQAIHTGQL